MRAPGRSAVVISRPHRFSLVSLALGLAALVGGSSAGSAAAQAAARAERPADAQFVISAGPDEEARTVFQAGREQYAAGDYEGALAAFRRAYELSGRPELQFNIGQTADRLRRDREARDAFEEYLRAMPDAANRVEVEARLRVLREQIALDDALRGQVARAADPPIVEQWWFWTLIGVAVAGAGVGIGFAIGSRDELAAPTPGDLGPGGIIVALEAP